MCPKTGEANFIKTLVHFDKDNISDRVLKKIGQYCRMSDFQPEIIGKVSLAAKSLCMWVRAMEVLHGPNISPQGVGAGGSTSHQWLLPLFQVYGRIYRVVEPKRMQLNTAKAQLEEKQTALAEAQSKLREVTGPPAAALAPSTSVSAAAGVDRHDHAVHRWQRSWTR